MIIACCLTECVCFFCNHFNIHYILGLLSLTVLCNKTAASPSVSFFLVFFSSHQVSSIYTFFFFLHILCCTVHAGQSLNESINVVLYAFTRVSYVRKWLNLPANRMDPSCSLKAVVTGGDLVTHSHPNSCDKSSCWTRGADAKYPPRMLLHTINYIFNSCLFDRKAEFCFPNRSH